MNEVADSLKEFRERILKGDMLIDGFRVTPAGPTIYLKIFR